MEAPELYGATGFCSSQFTSNEKHHSFDSNKSIGGGVAGGDHFIVEDLLDFSNEDEDAMITDPNYNNNNNNIVTPTTNSTDSSTATFVDSCNSSSFSGCEPSGFNGDIGSHYTNNFSHHDVHFGSELCVPYDDLAELEWVSNFVEESFSSEDLQRLQLITGMKARPDESSETRHFQTDDNNNGNVSNICNNNTMFNPEMAVPAKARSKRSRAAPGNWASRLLVLSPTTSSSEPEIIPGSTQHPNSGKKTIKGAAGLKKGDGGVEGGEGRKCLHCATDKTPQWRTGPMGPKTLCNACGVRYKSGRLVPEYRPAASPTFMLTKHSNSHRKVLELRRQKEMVRTHQHQHQHQHQQFLHHHQSMMFDVSNGGDDYLIHQHAGPDFRQMI